MTFTKVAYVSHVPGHHNSKGELAEWVIKSHETGEILSSHTSKEKAEEHLQQMHAHKTADFKEVETRAEVEEELDNPLIIQAVIEFLREGESTVISIKEGVTGFPDCALVSLSGGKYVVVSNSVVADEYATALVKKKLLESPEEFDRMWYESLADFDEIGKSLRPEMEEEIKNNPETFGWAESSDEAFDEWVANKVEEILNDPFAYLVDILGLKEGLKEAWKLGNVNVDEAASEAVMINGADTYLSTITDLPGGGVYWKYNG